MSVKTTALKALHHSATLAAVALLSALLAALLAITAPPAAAATVLLLDTFSDDTVGNLPNGAEVGSAVYPGLSVPATTTTDYRVFNDSGNQRLRVTSPGPAGVADNGSLIDYFPTAFSAASQVSYFYRIEAGASMVGLNAFGQELVMSPFGVNLELLWGNDGHLHVGTTDVGAGAFSIADTGFAWALGQDYEVTWLINGAAGLFSILIDGATIVNNQAHVPMAGIQELAFFNNFNTTGAQVIDDVTITTVPEPGSLALVALALVAAARAQARVRG